jgi:hypothetical protein
MFSKQTLDKYDYEIKTMLGRGNYHDYCSGRNCHAEECLIKAVAVEHLKGLGEQDAHSNSIGRLSDIFEEKNKNLILADASMCEVIHMMLAGKFPVLK